VRQLKPAAFSGAKPHEPPASSSKRRLEKGWKNTNYSFVPQSRFSSLGRLFLKEQSP